MIVKAEPGDPGQVAPHTTMSLINRHNPSKDAVRVTEACPLYLLRPHIRYADRQPRTLARVRRSEHTGWTRSAENVWTVGDDTLRIDAAIDEGSREDRSAPRIISLTATAIASARIGFCAVELAFPALTPPNFIDRTLRLRPLRGAESLNDYSPLFLRWKDDQSRSYELRNFQGFSACRLAWRDSWLRVVVLLDAAALHPRWQLKTVHSSAAAPEWRPGQSLTVRLLLADMGGHAEPPPVWLGRYPAGREAAFAVTDHCDFDTKDRLRAFLYGNEPGRGWLGRGLRLTKSVFAVETKPEGLPADTLRDDEYRQLIEALAEDGSEIAPHSLNEWGDLDLKTFEDALARLAAEWSPRIWIDHGYLPYNYAMGGGDDARYRLLDRLASHGFFALAADHDIPTDSYASLNMMASPPSELRAVASAAWCHFRQGRNGIALRYLRGAVKRRLVGPFGYVLDGMLLSVGSVAKFWERTRHFSRENLRQSWGLTWRRLRALARSGPNALRISHTRKELLEVASVVYPERGVPLAQACSDEMLLFTTMEAVHTKDVYTPHALTRLLEERGLHIGHTYLLNELPYIAGVFDQSRMPRLSTEWESFVDALANATSAERLWNPTASALLQYMRNVQHVSVLPDLDHEAAVVINRLRRAQRNITILLPRSIHPEHVTWAGAPPIGWRYWSDWLAVWGDLEAGQSARIEWADARRSREDASLPVPAALSLLTFGAAAAKTSL